MSDRKLCACRFCGGEGKLRVFKMPHENKPDTYYWYVRCQKCGTDTLYDLTKESAIKHWNEGVYTKETLMLKKPLKAENMTNEGVLMLTEAVLKDTRLVYERALRKMYENPTHANCNEVGILERHMKQNMFIRFLALSPDDVIKTLKRKVQNEIH